MICQHREVCRLVAVAAEIVESLARFQAAALHEHHRIGVLHRRNAARAELAHETGSAIVGPDGFAVGQLTDGELSPCSACNQVFVSGQPLQIIVLAGHQRDGDSHIGRHLTKRLGREVVEVTGHAAPHLLTAAKPQPLTEERHIAGPAVGARPLAKRPASRCLVNAHYINRETVDNCGACLRRADYRSDANIAVAWVTVGPLHRDRNRLTRSHALGRRHRRLSLPSVKLRAFRVHRAIRPGFPCI